MLLDFREFGVWHLP